MTILFDARRPSKMTRRPFGQGVAPEVPSADDIAWWAAESDRLERQRYNRHLEERAREAYATDCLCRGLILSDLAEALVGSSLIGHPA
jgi:hypothetical protein